jgi:hypothetical protein
VATLNELLDAEPRPSETPPSDRFAGRWLIRAALWVAALSGALVLAASVVGVRLWYPFVFVGLLTLVVLHRAVTALEVVPAADDPPEPAERVSGGDDGFARALQRWRVRLSWDQAGLWRSSRTLHPAMADLVDERLRQRWGITRTGDPTRARAVLGDRLWSYLEHTPAEPPAVDELSALVDDLERI